MLLTRENVCFDWAFCNLSDDRKDFFFIDELWFPYISNLISALLLTSLGFPGGSVVKIPLVNAEDASLILGWEDTLEKEMETHSSILVWEIPWTEEPGWLKFMGLQRVRRDLATKPEKAMAPHSSTLAWRIPGTGEPGGLPSMGSHRVGHD